MFINGCKIELLIFEANSLKDKRIVLKSIIERIKKRFNVSIAEVDDNEIWNKAVIGIATLSNSSRHNNDTIDKIIHFIDNDHRAEIVQIEDYK